jgi:hypothetical protein
MDTGALENPMFAVCHSVTLDHPDRCSDILGLWQVTLNRDTIDISGQGQLTLGKLPDGVDNSSLTWVPVRPYTPDEGGLSPPTFAPNEVYPLYAHSQVIILIC